MAPSDGGSLCQGTYLLTRANSFSKRREPRDRRDAGSLLHSGAQRRHSEYDARHARIRKRTRNFFFGVTMQSTFLKSGFDSSKILSNRLTRSGETDGPKNRKDFLRPLGTNSRKRTGALWRRSPGTAPSTHSPKHSVNQES